MTNPLVEVLYPAGVGVEGACELQLVEVAVR